MSPPPLRYVIVLPLELDPPFGGLDEPHGRPPEGGLAAAGFAHEPQGFAGPDFEIDPVHRLHPLPGPEERRALELEVLFEPRYRKKRPVHASSSVIRMQAAW